MAIPFTIINLDKPRKVRFCMGAMVEFEQSSGIKLTTIADEFSLKEYLTILWVCLRQDDKDLTFEDTLKLVDDYTDDVSSIVKTIERLVADSFSKPKEGTIPNVKKPLNG